MSVKLPWIKLEASEAVRGEKPYRALWLLVSAMVDIAWMLLNGVFSLISRTGKKFPILQDSSSVENRKGCNGKVPKC